MPQSKEPESEYEPDICDQCNGSGEGYTDRSRCTKCRGSGVLDYHDAADIWDYADYYYDEEREEIS